MAVGRNDPCICGSGKKYKKCCINKAETSSFEECNRYIAIGDKISAEKIWLKSKDKFSLPENEHLGLAAYQKSLFSLSEKILSLAVKQNSKNALVSYYLGFMQGARYDYKDALVNIKRAYQLDKRSCGVAAGYALVLTKVNRYEEAKAIINTAKALGCRGAEIDSLSYLVSKSEGKHAEVIDMLVKIPSLVSSEHERKFLIASAFFKLGEYERVLEIFKSTNYPIFYSLSNFKLIAHSYLALWGLEKGMSLLKGYENLLLPGQIYLHAAKYCEEAGLRDKQREFILKCGKEDLSNELGLQDVLLMASLREGMLSEAEIFQLHKEIAATFISKKWDSRPLLKRNKKIRVGFVSPDFRRHSVLYFIEPIFRTYNKSKFEFFAYFTFVEKWDGATEKLIDLVDDWKSFSSGDEISKAISNDCIDILFDLAGHTVKNSLRAFSQRLAPVQASWIGYPFSTGMMEMDYWIGDKETLGLDSQPLFTEKLVRLPNVFSTYSPLHLRGARIDPTCNDMVVFGSFNNWDKVTDEVLLTWARLLLNMSNSRLVAKAHQLKNEQLCENVHAFFERHSVNKDRVELIGWIDSQEKHLAMYNSINVVLDTFPYNGTTTTCEALWMGLPVITLLGDSHRARVGASFLSSIGREDWVAHSLDEYISIAISVGERDLNGEHDRVLQRNALRESALFNADLFMKDFEEVLESLYSA